MNGQRIAKSLGITLLGILMAGPMMSGAAFGNSSGQGVFDVKVSLHNAPAGDNDASSDSGAGDDEQNAYETIFQNFADSVCEQTNGVHKIGKVEFYKNWSQKGLAHIWWDDSGRPGAHTTGYGKSGWRIFMYDNFGSISVTNGGDDLQRLGYIVGHEWGHYTLGLYDEYSEAGRTAAQATRPSQPIDTDTPTNQAIMRSGRTAVNGNFNWLNHSTQNNIGDIDKTAQGRVYRKSGWDTLIQTTSKDSTTVNAWNVPRRTHYTNLVGAQPTAADNWFKVQLPGSRTDCRSDLNIVWVDDLAVDIVLDVSGSMAGSPLDNAKAAASIFVGLLKEDETAAGLTTFESSVHNNADIRPIASAADKDTLKQAIANLRTLGNTAMFDGAVAGLEKLEQYSPGAGSNQFVLLLTDGGDNNSSNTLATTTARFNAAGVPVIAFGYGSFFDQRLPALAHSTGGQFFQSPTTPGEIQQLFAQAFAAISGSSTLSSASGEVSASSTEEEEFIIDSTIESADIIVLFDGTTSDVTVSLVKQPAGTDSGVVFACEAGGSSVSCTATLDDATIARLGTGTYQVRVANNTNDAIDASVIVLATTKSGEAGGTYTVSVSTSTGETVQYPQPIILSVVVARNLPITGLTVAATITDPSGTEQTIDLNDDGVDADRYADDGLYSAWAPYSAAGTHTVRVQVTNPNGDAVYTDDALSTAHPEPGDTITLPTLSDENFMRVSTQQILVENVLPDDHPDDPTSGSSCTNIAADNSPAHGRFDRSGDVDCFFIAPPLATTDPLTVRAFNRALGADPEFSVYGADGSTVIAKADPTVTNASDGSLSVVVAAADIDSTGMVVAVSDSDDTASGGTYSVSAGEALGSDQLPAPVTPPTPVTPPPTPVTPPATPVTPPASRSGGTLGHWFLLMLGLLGAGGLYMRRRRM